MWRRSLPVAAAFSGLLTSSQCEPLHDGDKIRLTRRFTRRKQTKAHRYVVVGSGTAANAAIEAIRQEDASADILVLSDEHALPRHDFGSDSEADSESDSDVESDVSSALLESYNEWRRHLSAHFEEDAASSSSSANGPPPPVTLLLDKRPLEFDVEKNRVLLGDGTEVRYERCLIASAGRPRHFYVLDSDRVSYALKDRVNTCTTRADFVRLDQVAAGGSEDVQSVLVIGAGFLGCEVACALATDDRNDHVKTKLVFVEQSPAARTLPPYLAEELGRRLSRAGVEVVPDKLVTSLRPSGDDDDNESDSGVTVGVLGKDKPETSLDADYVVLASTHTDPAPTLRMGRATRAGGGLERDEKNGGLVVNAQLEAVSGLFVAGNAASYYDPYLGRRRVDRYDHAVNSGLTAGRNMARSLRGAGKMKTYRHQPLFRSNLPGVGVLIEGIGEVDSSLRTVGVWVQPPNISVGPNGGRGMPYERGVVYYLKGNKIMGILLWNASDVLESARQLMLSRPEIRDNVMEELKHTISLAPNDWLHVVSTASPKEELAMKKATRVYVGDASNSGDGVATAVPDATAAERKAKRKFVSRLSHDISTEQLFTDDLIDGKVADGEDDENGSGTDSDDHASTKGGAQKGQMYRIESHSALSSLESKYLEKVPSTDGSLTPGMEPRPAARTHKLAPLPGSPTARNAEAPTSSGSMTRTSPLSTTPEKKETATQQQLQVCTQCSKSREMPPMHCAAYSGHVTCLELLLQKADAEPEHPEDQSKKKKTTWLDKKQRTPLFYACAGDKLECCALLARVRRVWLNTPDRQMDTPVHVCCFFGWHKCLQLLLDAGADPHGRNAKGFKPSHLAATPECLEALLAFGDDLLQGDKLGRSPLFVACARNRVACVEFLCAWNNQSRSWMLELEDQRGDRAIHAAACNGSTDSLAVLLRYGADPLTNNAKGMSPKDLAVANKHPDCEALLVQAEKEHSASAGTSWLAPANAADTTDNNYGDPKADGSSDWVQCWDNDSGQAFYYNNLTGKCQWEVPAGYDASFQAQRVESSTNANQQYNGYSESGGDSEDGNEEYVWVKKKKQTVCVVTGRETEWTAVQDPVSRAIYYKNTRTGQSQWEEPDAVRELASAAGARTSQEASRVWETLDKSRSALAAAIAREKRRQLEAHEQTLLQARLYIRQRREDIAKREEQARLAQLLPRSSFVRRKKQSMMMKVTTHNRQATKTSGKAVNGKGKRQSSLDEALNENDEEDDGPSNDNDEGDEEEEGGAEARLEEICSNEPALDMFLSTYLKLRGVRDLQVLTTEKRLSNCLFHYYVALVDPVNQRGMSKSQFRVVLRDMNVIPGGAPAASTSASSLVPSHSGGGAGTGAPPLKLHVTDLIFSQAERAMAQEGSPTHASRMAHRQAAPIAAAGDTHLSLGGFTAAMIIVRERVVAQVEQSMQQAGGEDPEIDDDEEWFMLRYLVPLSLRLGARLLTQIRRCKELDLQLTGSQEPTAVAARQLLAANRAAVQLLHRHYSRRELHADTDGAVPIVSTPKAAAPRRLAMLTFRGLAMFASDFNLLTPGTGLPALHFLLEAINWISGSAHTEVISFEKFQLLLVMLAVLPLSAPGASPWSSWINESANGGASPQSNSRPLAEQLALFFKKLAGSPALVRVTAESNIGGNDDGATDSGLAPEPRNPQPLFVLVVPSDGSTSTSNQE